MAAGLGFKTFTTGEVLTAADTNGYLMQGVLVFASAAARDAAITSPQEGQCCYLKDTDAVLTYSGTAWVGFDDSNAIQNAIVNAKGDLIGASANDTPAILSVGANGETLVADSSTATGLKWAAPAAAGKVLQVVTANITTDTTITSTSYTDTNLTATITPTSATSKVLVLFALQCRLSTTANDTVAFGLKLLRDATAVVDMSAGSNTRAFAIQATADGVPTLASTIYTNYNFLDSPATTSATTYKVQAALNSTANSRSARFQMQDIPSVMTLLEIGA